MLENRAKPASCSQAPGFLAANEQIAHLWRVLAWRLLSVFPIQGSHAK